MNVNGNNMIIDGPEYLHAALNDMKALRHILEGNPFTKDYASVKRELDCRIKFYEGLVNNLRCINCFHYRSETASPMGAMCNVNGLFPENIKPGEYFCGAYVFDDVPF